jgi:hypothetical protein
MNTNLLIKAICVFVLGCSISGCNEKYDKVVEKDIYVNNSSLNLFVGDRLQLTASPDNVTYVWSVEDPAVVSVSATGLVEAVGAGSTGVVISHDGVRKTIPVTVVVKIPLTDVNVSVESVVLAIGDKVQANARPVPADANDVALFEWTSENPAVATVSATGVIEAVSKGATKIIVVQGNIRKEISVSVIALLDKTGWGADADSFIAGWGDGQGNSGAGNGGYPARTIDGDITSAWHSATGGTMPRYVIIDMLQRQSIYIVELYLHPRYQYAKTVRIYVSDAPEEASWNLATEIQFPSGVSTKVNFPDAQQGQYLIIYFTNSTTNTYANLAEINVFGS